MFSIFQCLDQSHALFVYNNRLNRTLSTMNEENKIVTEKKISTENAKDALKGALKGIPKSFLLKVILKFFLFVYFKIYFMF